MRRVAGEAGGRMNQQRSGDFGLIQLLLLVQVLLTAVLLALAVTNELRFQRAQQYVERLIEKMEPAKPGKPNPDVLRWK